VLHVATHRYIDGIDNDPAAFSLGGNLREGGRRWNLDATKWGLICFHVVLAGLLGWGWGTTASKPISGLELNLQRHGMYFRRLRCCMNVIRVCARMMTHVKLKSFDL